MISSRDIIIGVIGFSLSLYGSIEQNSLPLITGVLIILLDIYLITSELEDNIKILKAQINTTRELQKIRVEINEIKKLNEERIKIQEVCEKRANSREFCDERTKQRELCSNLVPSKLLSS